MRKDALALLGTTLLGALAYARRTEPLAVVVRPMQVWLPRLHPAFDGYRIAHISDIHADRWMDGERLAAIVARINALQPDLVAITGDLITNSAPYCVEGMIAALGRLWPRDGAVAVLGNHDHADPAGPLAVRRILRESGILELPNCVHTLRRGNARLHIAGVDDVVFHQARLELVLRQLPEDGAAILLAHEPDFADISAAAGRFDLQLSGHSHGGQVRLPLLGALILPRYARRYPLGAYVVNGMALYTNPGLGTVTVRLRLNCPPEITILTLRACSAADRPTGDGLWSPGP